MAEVRASRRGTNFAQAAVYTLIFIAILVTANFLANRYNKTLDTTANKRYSLSDQSAKIARELEQPLTISYWDRPDGFDRARGLFDRYKNLSPKIDVKYEDIDRSRTAAMAAGVNALGTIIVQVGNKREVAKTLTEEDVTGAIVRALKGGDRTVCFTLGAGEGSADDTGAPGYASVKALTEKNNYKTSTLKLLEKPEIPMYCTILVVGGPKRDLIQPAVDAIKNYVEGGGHAMVMLDPPLKIGGGIDDNAALSGVLAGWGVKLHRDLVLDASGVGQLFGLGPEAPLVTTYEGHAIGSTMKDNPSLFPITQSMEAVEGTKAKVSKLFGTTEDSVATRKLDNPNISMKDAADKGPFTLGLAGELDTGKEGVAKARFVVLGTSRWIANSYLAFNGNRDLYMNMINWLSSDEDLISIRPKDPEDRPLNMNVRQVTTLFYSSVLGLPLLVVLAGVGVWLRRRRN